jgi:hypothetical protein
MSARYLSKMPRNRIQIHETQQKGQRRDYSRWPHFGLRRPLEPIQTFSTRHKPSEGVASVGILKSVLSKVKVNLS